MRCGIKTGTSPIWVKRSLTNSAFFLCSVYREKVLNTYDNPCVAPNFYTPSEG